jgi:uncharacterized protein (UPF0212 family)
MLPDCIDPKEGDLLRKMIYSIAKNIAKNADDFFSYVDVDVYEVVGSRLHWNSCPACRSEFGVADVPAIFAYVGCLLEIRYQNVFSESSADFLKKKHLLLAEANVLPDSYAELIACLARDWEEDGLSTLLRYGQEALSLRVPPVSTSWSAEEGVLSLCREFICSLKTDVQHYVVSAALSYDLFSLVYERIEREAQPNSGSGWTPTDHCDFFRRFQAAIANSEVRPHILFQTIELAAVGYTRSYIDNLQESHLTTAFQMEPSRMALVPQEMTVLPNVLQEMKQDFDNALDSLKAGQMETIRLIEHNQRPAAAYESDIEARLGAFLYSRLGETTQKGLQVAEYLYHINSQEPNYFPGPVMQMALAYENELAVRIVWPFVSELQAAGEESYDGQGVSREPLLSGGKVPRSCMMLGNLARYLRKDPVMQSKISGLGFDADAIAKDAISIASLRNRAAHEPVCERAVADDLRQRMLCPDGIFSRLHPAAVRRLAK